MQNLRHAREHKELTARLKQSSQRYASLHREARFLHSWLQFLDQSDCGGQTGVGAPPDICDGSPSTM